MFLLWEHDVTSGSLSTFPSHLCWKYQELVFSILQWFIVWNCLCSAGLLKVLRMSQTGHCNSADRLVCTRKGVPAIAPFTCDDPPSICRFVRGGTIRILPAVTMAGLQKLIQRSTTTTLWIISHMCTLIYHNYLDIAASQPLRFLLEPGIVFSNCRCSYSRCRILKW